MIVKYKPTGQLGEIPDDKFDPNLFEVAQASSPQSQVRGTSTVRQPQQQQNTVGLDPNVAKSMNKPVLNRVVNAVGDMFAPTVKKMGLEVDANRRMAPNIQAANREIDVAQRTVDQLFKQAESETDPNKKRAILKQIQDIDASLQSNARNLSTMGFEESGMTQQDLANLSTNPIPTAINQGIGAAGEIGSWFTPTGKAPQGANYVQKVLQGAKAGGKVGLVRGITKPTQDPESLRQRAINTATDTTGGAVGGAAVSAVVNAPSVIKNLGKQISQVGDKTIQAQYNLPRSQAKDLNLRDTIKQLSDYGISNIDDVERVSPKVTGSDGAITKLQRKILGATKENIDLAGVMDNAKDLADDPLMAPGQDKKFVTFIKKMLGKSLGTADDSITNASAIDTFEAIQKLEKQAYAIGGRNIQLTAEQQALRNAYLSIAEELKFRLYDKTDDIAVSGILQQNPELFNQLSEVSPKLAENVSKAGTISDLRSLAAPFVRGGIATETTNAGADLSVANWGGSVRGVGKLVQNPMNLAAVPLSSNAFNAGAGQLLHNTGNVINKLPKMDASGPVGTWFSGQVGGKAGSRMFDSPAVEQNPQEENYQTQNYNSSPSYNETSDNEQSQVNQVAPSNNFGYTPEQLGQAYFKAMMAGDTKSASQLKQMYDMAVLYQKQQEQDQLSSAVQTKLASVKTAKNMLDDIQIKADSLNLGDNGIFSRVGGAVRSRKAEAGLDPAVYNYQNYIDQVKVTLAKAMGQVGDISKTEQENAVKLIENAPYMTREEFNQGIQDLKDIFNNYEANLLMSSGQGLNFTNGQQPF